MVVVGWRTHLSSCIQLSSTAFRRAASSLDLLPAEERVGAMMRLQSRDAGTSRSPESQSVRIPDVTKVPFAQIWKEWIV